MSNPSKGPRLWLRKRKGREPVYIIRGIGPREISTGIGPDDSAGAHQAFADYLATHFRPNTGQRDLAAITVAEVLKLYGLDIAPTKASAATIGYHMKALLPFWGEKTLADVKGNTCRSYLKSRNKDGLSLTPYSGPSLNHSVKPSTVRRELKTLQAAINHWHRESPLAAVPKVTLPPEGERRERVLERSEVAAMLRAARRLKLNHVARFILIGVYTGTRHNAILRLRWTPAIVGGHIDVARSILYRRGSGEKDTSKRRPPVGIRRSLANHVARWRRNAECDFVIAFQGQSILKMKRAWAHVVREAGLGRDVTPHVLRHTAASWLLWQGHTIWDVAGVIGADASTVQKVYGHHRLEVEQRKCA